MQLKIYFLFFHARVLQLGPVEFSVGSAHFFEVDEILEHFFIENKTLFDAMRLAWNNENKTDDLKLYVKKIKENASKFDDYPL